MRVQKNHVAPAPRREAMPLARYLKELTRLVFDKTGWPADLSRFARVLEKNLPTQVLKAAGAWAAKEDGYIDDARRIDVGGRTAFVVSITIPNDAETSWGTFKVFDPAGRAFKLKAPK